MKFKSIIFIVLIAFALSCVVSATPQLYLDQYNASLKLNMHMNGTQGGTIFTDDTGKTVTPHGNAITTTAIKRLGNASYYGDGSSGTYLLIPDSADFDFGGGNLTISGFYNISSSATGICAIYGQLESGGHAPILVEYMPSTNKMAVLFANNTGTFINTDNYVSTNTFSRDAWHHFVVTRNTTLSSNQFKLYVDGNLEWNYTSTAILYNAPEELRIGYYFDGDTTYSYFYGHADELGVWKDAAIPIEELYPQTVEIETAIPPTATFTAVPTSGADPLSVQLTETSTSSGTSWVWNATNVTGNNVPFTFNTTSGSPIQAFSQGNYSISLKSTNAGGSNISTQVTFVNVSLLPIHADFSLFNTAGTAPFTTYLYDQSTNLTGSETFSWLLGDGNTSTSKNLYYTWNITGTYSVNHSVSNGVTTSWKNVSDMITVGTPVPPVVAPVASFYGGPQIGGVPLTVFFTDVSTNTPTSWNWSMGDGTYDETQNPSHIYTGSGFFTVNLTATNSAGSNTTSQNNFVMVY